MKRAKIIGTGSLIVDITGYASHLPVDGETVLGNVLRFGPGGKGNNQMTAAHRAGAETFIISRRGNDFLGKIIEEHYLKEKMSEKYITVCENSETGSALIEVNTQTAQNRIIVVKGVCDEITADDVRKAEPDFVDCDAVLTQLETTIESVKECKMLAKKHHKPFILNPAPFQKVPSDLFCGVDYVTPNETEAEFFTGIPVIDEKSASIAAKKFLDMGARNVLITMGSKGVFFANSEIAYFEPGIKVKAVDTTGAGDAFNGGFAVAVAEKMPIETALKFANCTGALSVTKHGTAPAMPNRAEIMKMFV